MRFNLGLMFYMGEGVSQDHVRAYAWISIADAQGNSDKIKDAIELVAESMTQDEIVRAQMPSAELWKSFGPARKIN